MVNESRESKSKCHKVGIIGLCTLLAAGIITTACLLTSKQASAAMLDSHDALGKMLATEPSTNSDAARMWNRMHPLNATYFAHYYELAYNSSIY